MSLSFTNHSSGYFSRMDSAIDQKSLMLEWLQPGAAAELGSGSGAFAELIAAESIVDSLLAIDASTEAVELLEGKFSDSPKVSVLKAVLGEDRALPQESFATIFASSIFHEVYSFLGRGAFLALLFEIFGALEPGGIFVLRDGVVPDGPDSPARMVVADRLLPLAERYAAEGPGALRPSLAGNVATGNRHQIAEMAFTITWGEGSFEREIREQYQIQTLSGYESLLSGVGFEVLARESFIQPGYPENLGDCPMETLDSQGGWTPWFPATNALWVARKPELA